MLWASRRILWILVVRDLKVRYSNTVLGFLWTLLDPLLLALTYWFVFGVIVARGAPEEQPYLLWLLTGILPFQWTAHVLGDSGRLLGGDAKLVTASNMPREIWVLRSVMSRFIEFLFTLPITAVAMLLFAVFTDKGQSCDTGCLSQVGPSWWLFAIPLAFVVQFVLNLGFAFTLSPTCMLYPDIHRIVRVFATLYRYMSPVIYGLAGLQAISDERGWPSWVVHFYALNPLVGILNTYHAVIFPRTPPTSFGCWGSRRCSPPHCWSSVSFSSGGSSRESSRSSSERLRASDRDRGQRPRHPIPAQPDPAPTSR